jgi:uncharacterized protein
MPAITPPKPSKPKPANFDSAAVARLEGLLFDRMQHSDSMPMEGVDGLFCAAWLAPGADVTFEEVLPVVLDGTSTPVPDELHDLLAAFWARIGKRLVRTPDGDITDLLPMIAFPMEPGGEVDATGAEPMPPDFPVGAAWAAGFLMGCGLRQDAWAQRLDRNEDLQWQFIDIVDMSHVDDDDLIEMLNEADENFDPSAIEPPYGDKYEDVLEPFGPEVFDEEDLDEADEADLWDEADESEPEPMTLNDRLELIADLPAFLHELHLVSINERSAHAPVRRVAGPGRNDACPCGSGLKFKHCHGDPGRRH